MKKVKTEKQMVHGKVDTQDVEIRQIDDILGLKKGNKFGKYTSREEYESSLFGLSHRELCEEALRVGASPSAIKEVCRNKCLAEWDKSKKVYKYTAPVTGKQSLDEIIKQGRK